MQTILIIAIVFIFIYINQKVAVGDNMQLILVKLITIILGTLTVSILLTKVVMPKEINSANNMAVFHLIKDITLLIVGYIFGDKVSKQKQ
jgi:hypothetical protein